ncbi:MAG: hypothetical protein ACTSRM_02980 [Alphaproteobacteria bacterium]
MLKDSRGLPHAPRIGVDRQRQDTPQAEALDPLGANNAGPIFWWDILTPLVLLITLLISAR